MALVLSETWKFAVIAAGAVSLGLIAYRMTRNESDTKPATLEELRATAEQGQDEMTRAQAADDLGMRNDIESIPLLLKAMEDDSPLVRARAGVAIQRLFGGVDYQFRASLPPEERAKIIERLRADYQSLKKANAFKQPAK